ncbi:MAG: hypothetical protein ACIARQ_15075 [Phycisphaerales bacterium JB061]
MSLKSDIADWDGKSADDIRAVYDAHHTKRGFLKNIVSLTKDPELAVGSTWLLKHHFDEGGAPIGDELAFELFGYTDSLTHWEARLHVLQCMQHIPVPTKRAQRVERFVSSCLSEEKKFVRAWAYSAYRDLAAAHPKYRAQAEDLLEDALATETAGSVLARVRKVIKKGF